MFFFVIIYGALACSSLLVCFCVCGCVSLKFLFGIAIVVVIVFKLENFYDFRSFIHLHSAFLCFAFFFCFCCFALLLHRTKFIIVSNEMSVRKHRSTGEVRECNCAQEKQLQ